ncbi:phage tail protein [Achromobacter sp. MY14]|uniref:phage tail protein n=1 Tax=unclassified Achromobacter TaxID=2626865 RepID=UPI001E2AD05E|nr:phage tail protein [Achromobacter sp. MY14]MCD0495912.1 phage tail protein [Achromobacter sp. MY14]
MSSIFINGSQFRVSKSMAQAVAITAIANSVDPLASTATPPSNGDVLLIDSGWAALTESVYRAIDATADGFKLEGADTTELRLHPAGQGAGSYREVTDWFSLDQITDVQITGGEQQYHQYQYVEDPSAKQRQKPTVKSPTVLTYTLDYDRSKAWYAALTAADRLRSPVVLETKYPDGSVTYYYGYPSFNKNPTGGQNVNLQNGFTLSLIADPVNYEGA